MIAPVFLSSKVRRSSWSRANAANPREIRLALEKYTGGDSKKVGQDKEGRWWVDTGGKKQIVEQTCGGLVELVTPTHGFAQVGGMEGIKAELSRIAADIRDGQHRRVPMGLLFVGAMGIPTEPGAAVPKSPAPADVGPVATFTCAEMACA
jgi:hypothetical protein